VPKDLRGEERIAVGLPSQRMCEADTVVVEVVAGRRREDRSSAAGGDGR